MGTNETREIDTVYTPPKDNERKVEFETENDCLG